VGGRCQVEVFEPLQNFESLAIKSASVTATRILPHRPQRLETRPGAASQRMIWGVDGSLDSRNRPIWPGGVVHGKYFIATSTPSLLRDVLLMFTNSPDPNLAEVLSGGRCKTRHRPLTATCVRKCKPVHIILRLSLLLPSSIRPSRRPSTSPS
jgi:hypothetical protein